MQELHGDGRPDGAFSIGRPAVGGRQHEQRTQALATAEDLPRRRRDDGEVVRDDAAKLRDAFGEVRRQAGLSGELRDDPMGGGLEERLYPTTDGVARGRRTADQVGVRRTRRPFRFRVRCRPQCRVRCRVR
ncbi:hypothetical protein GCM10029978_059010 [Actinoallomurus acanthiterrae]